MRTLLMSMVTFAALFGAITTARAAEPDLTAFYTKIDNPSPPGDPSKIRVQEFFWFGCPHCFKLDPLISAWAAKLPADVIFERVPNNLGNPIGVLDEQAFYVAKLLGIEHKIHTPLFDAIQVQRLPLNSRAALRAFFVKTAGITAEQYDAAADSFEVDSNVRRADQLAQTDRILSVPSIVVAGKYHLDLSLPGYAKIQGDELARDRKMLAVAGALIDRVRAERAAGD